MGVDPLDNTDLSVVIYSLYSQPHEDLWQKLNAQYDIRGTSSRGDIAGSINTPGAIKNTFTCLRYKQTLNRSVELYIVIMSTIKSHADRAVKGNF